MSEPMHIACPACASKNRLPRDKLDQQPKCGHCGQALFQGQPAQLTDANFAGLVQGTDVPVIVDCWAEWCGPCRRFAPVFEQAARSLEPGFRLLKLDTEANQATAARLGIRSIPTLIVFKGGKEVARISGAMALGPFLEWARQQA